MIKCKKKVQSKDNKKDEYYVYMIRCEGNRVYTGITIDIKKRFLQHKGELIGGAKFTKAFKPVKIEKVWKVKDRSEALKMECSIKKLGKVEKEALINNDKRGRKNGK